MAELRRLVPPLTLQAPSVAYLITTNYSNKKVLRLVRTYNFFHQDSSVGGC